MIDALDYIPHSGSMALIESISDSGEGWIECLVDVSKSFFFTGDDGKVPSWLGIEYMAQSIAAYAGITAKKNGSAVKLGFLLGTRDYTCSKSRFELEEKLMVKAEVIFQNDDLASFNCIISTNGMELAKARINVYQPQDVKKIIEDEINE